MTTLDKAIRNFGFEDPRTITIAFLEEEGKSQLAEELYEVLTASDDEDEDEDFDYIDESDESGFDPYEGCYTYDC